jgi:TPR repeat protein
MSKAAFWYQQASERGDMNAQYSLGMMYDAGRGVSQSYKKAAALYLAAAENGHVESQVNLGVVFVKGERAVQNYIQAHMWFNIAASRGNNVARDYRDHIAKKMVPQDISTAQKLAQSCVLQKYIGCSSL